MTLSIVARDPRTGEFGSAALTYMLASGKLVTWVRPGVGAAVTQAFPNPYLAHDAFDLLAQGYPTPEAVDVVVGKDPGSRGRQFAVVGHDGEAAAFTGEAPEDWKGHRTGAGWSVQGNRLTGPEVLDAMAEAFAAAPDDELVQRLLAALRAGDDAGGDRLGHRSASVEVYGRESYPLWEVRVDVSERPMERLLDAYEVVRGELWPEIQRMPTRANPHGDLRFDDPKQAV